MTTKKRLKVSEDNIALLLAAVEVGDIPENITEAHPVDHENASRADSIQLLEEKSERLQDKVTELEGYLALANELLTPLNNKNTRLEASLAAFEQTFDKYKETIEQEDMLHTAEVKKMIERYVAAIEELEENNRLLALKNDGLKVSFADQEKNLQAIVESQKQQVNELTVVLNNANDKCTTLEYEVTRLQFAVNFNFVNYKTKEKNYSSENENLKSIASNQESELVSLRADLSEKHKLINEMLIMHQEFKEYCEKFLETLKLQFSEGVTKTAVLFGIVSTIHSKIETLEGHLAASNSHKAELESTIASLRQTIDNQSKATEVKNAEDAEIQQAFRAKIFNQQSQLANQSYLNTKISELEFHLKESNSRNVLLEQALIKSNARETDLAAKLAKMEQQIQINSPAMELDAIGHSNNVVSLEASHQDVSSHSVMNLHSGSNENVFEPARTTRSRTTSETSFAHLLMLATADKRKQNKKASSLRQHGLYASSSNEVLPSEKKYSLKRKAGK